MNLGQFVHSDLLLNTMHSYFLDVKHYNDNSTVFDAEAILAGTSISFDYSDSL